MIDFSILIPTHNREKKFKRALTSALNQDYSNYEIVISNDSEKDYSLGDSFLEDKRVKYFKKKPEGYDVNYQFLLSKAKGRYTYILEDDDVLFDPHVLRKVYNILSNTQDLNAVLVDIAYSYREALDSIKLDKKETKVYSNSEMFERFPSMSISFQLGQVFFRTDILRKTILEEVPNHLGSVNTDALIFLLICLYKGKVAHTNQKSYLLTFGDDNLSWFNYENCFFGSHAYIDFVYDKAIDILSIDLASWKNKMEEAQIEYLLKRLPSYLERTENGNS